MFKVADNTFSY